MPFPAGGRRTLTLLVPDGRASPEVFVHSTHTIVFDGRLFDREALDHADPDARGNADLVLRAFLREGSTAFATLRGSFAVVIWDRAGDSVVCAHDALGAFPLFYAQVDDALLVSPFQDVLLAQTHVAKSPNVLALAEWILFGVPDVNDTFFSSIHRLPPAHQLRFGREILLERYWHPEDDPLEIPAESAEAHAVFDQLLVQAVDRRLYLPRTSILLSGGLDSGVVAAVAAERTRAREIAAPLALSLAFRDPDSNEVATQRAVAAALGVELVLLSADEAGPEGFLLPLLETAGESPFPTTAPWDAAHGRLAAVARERGCRSIMTGDGGELLEASWDVAADLIRRGDVRAFRTLYRVNRSYYATTRRRMLWRLAWRSGGRIIIRDRAIGLAAKLTPDVIGAAYRRRYLNSIHQSLLPDEALRSRVVDRMLDFRPAPGRGAAYPGALRRLYDHPGTPLRLEANFAWGHQVGLEARSPLIDVDLIRFLYHAPPELLSFGDRAKGLAHASLELRTDHRLLRFRTAFFETFFRSIMLKEGDRALASLGGAPILSGLGIVDEEALYAAVRGNFSPGNIGYSAFWAILGLEAWLRARV